MARRSIGAQRNPESERAILRAARELIVAEGLSGFSIEAVARRARAGKPTIYRWWPSKALLLLDVYASLKDELPEPDTGTLEGDLAGFLSRLISFWTDTGAGNVFRAVLAEAQSDDAARQAVAAFHLERSAHTTAYFERSRADEQPLTHKQAQRLGELAFAYVFTKLLMGQLDVPKAEIDAVAAALAAAARN